MRALRKHNPKHSKILKYLVTTKHSIVLVFLVSPRVQVDLPPAAGVAHAHAHELLAAVPELDAAFLEQRREQERVAAMEQDFRPQLPGDAWMFLRRVSVVAS